MEYYKAILLTAVIFIPLERLLARHPGQKMLRRAWLNDVIYWLVNGQIIHLGLAVLVGGSVIVASWLVPVAVPTAVAAQPHWLQFLECVIAADLGFYLAHRAFHTVPWLWKIHAIHHSIEELDWLAGARVHPIDQIVTKSVSLLPVFVLGFSDVAIGAYMLLYAWQSVFLHSNVSIKFGPLRWLVASPEFHHWHHSIDAEARDRNFAAHLPLLDAVFGTLYMPRDREPMGYGLGEPMPESYPAQLLHPFRR
jgi:sterol desaturase/sphingolipid hydroxylase (fatty acid hydroxylase superfamily)